MNDVLHFKDWEDYLDKKPELNMNDYIYVGYTKYKVIGTRNDRYKYLFARILGNIPKEWEDE